MYPLLICFVLYWLYIAFLIALYATKRKRDTNTPPAPIERVTTENTKPLDYEGLKYYSVHWNLKTGEVIEERGED
jgi:hypothetical protein